MNINSHIEAQASALAQAAVQKAGLPLEHLFEPTEEGYRLSLDPTIKNTIYLAAKLTIIRPDLFEVTVTHLANYLNPQEGITSEGDPWSTRTRKAQQKCVSGKPVKRGDRRYSG